MAWEVAYFVEKHSIHESYLGESGLLVRKGPISTGYKMEIGPISTCYNKNYIEGLLDENGQWQEDETQVVDIVVDYYSNLFQSSNHMEFFEILEAV